MGLIVNIPFTANFKIWKFGLLVKIQILNLVNFQEFDLLVFGQFVNYGIYMEADSTNIVFNWVIKIKI